MSYKTGSQLVWMKWVLLISLLMICGAFVYITVWSFWQTRDWFLFLDTGKSGYVSLACALIFQYGQGPVLFLRSLLINHRFELEASLKRKTKGTAEYAVIEHDLLVAKISIWTLVGVFVLFGAVDAWTNREQMHAGLDKKRLEGAVIGPDKYLLTSVFGVVFVFVEEGLGLAFSLATHTLNDILEVHGRRRVKWLDAFGEIASSFSGGGGGPKGGGGGGQSYPRPASSFKGPGSGGGNNKSYYAQPAPKPSPGPSFEPTYHTPQVRAQDDMFKIND